MSEEQMAKTQPMPTPGRERVAPSLKEAFSDWIDQRAAAGMASYGRPLETFNGRDAERDAIEELLDFCQYRHQRYMELQTLVAREEAQTESAALVRQVEHLKQALQNAHAQIETERLDWESERRQWQQERAELLGLLAEAQAYVSYATQWRPEALPLSWRIKGRLAQL